MKRLIRKSESEKKQELIQENLIKFDDGQIEKYENNDLFKNKDEESIIEQNEEKNQMSFNDSFYHACENVQSLLEKENINKETVYQKANQYIEEMLDNYFLEVCAKKIYKEIHSELGPYKPTYSFQDNQVSIENRIKAIKELLPNIAKTNGKIYGLLCVYKDVINLADDFFNNTEFHYNKDKFILMAINKFFDTIDSRIKNKGPMSPRDVRWKMESFLIRYFTHKKNKHLLIEKIKL